MNHSIPTMTKEDWRRVYGFSENENWGDPLKMAKSLIYALVALRKYVAKPIIIHCGWEHRGSGWHPAGVAVDLHIPEMHVMDQFFAAERFDAFNGIGVYPFWNSPGLHLDVRPVGKLGEDSRWGCTENKKYVPLNWDFIKLL